MNNEKELPLPPGGDVNPDYECLAAVLNRAYLQAAYGKGAERHGQQLPFDRQPMQQLITLYGQGFALGQAAKKAQESQRLPPDAAVRELLGAINYLAGAVIHLEAQQPGADHPDFLTGTGNGGSGTRPAGHIRVFGVSENG